MPLNTRRKRDKHITYISKLPGLFPRYNAVYAHRFAKPYPVRTTVGSNLSALPGMLIEIDCIAYKPQERKSRGRGGKRPRKPRR